MMPRQWIKPIALVLLFLGAAGTSLWLHCGAFAEYATSEWIWGEDIFYIWSDGARVARGENPYDRIDWSDMRQNYKFPTYFPLFYELAAVTQRGAMSEFPGWLATWRWVFLVFDLAIAVLLYVLIDRAGSMTLGILAGLYWLFNRWTLDVAKVGQIDFIPILLLLLSLALVRRHFWWSLLLLSLSLALKQIAIFVVPLYLIWAWQASPAGRRGVRSMLAGLTISAVPILSSLPFLFWGGKLASAKWFIKSMLFSLTRMPDSHSKTMGLGDWLGFEGIPAKLPMFALMAMVYLLAMHKRLGRYACAMLVMLVFADFNSVSFRQYMCWYLALLPLALVDALRPDPIASGREPAL